MARDFTKTSGNYIDLGVGGIKALLNGCAKCSMHAFVYFDTFSAADGNADDRVIQGWIQNSSSGFEMCIDSSGGNGTEKLKILGRSGTGDGAQSKLSTTVVTASVWHSLGGVLDIGGDRIDPYLDGVAEGGGAVTFGQATMTFGTPTTSKDVISDVLTDTNKAIDGRIAEVAIWNDGLTAGEMLALSKGFSAALIRPQSLVFYLPIMGRNAPEIDWKGKSCAVTGTLNQADHCKVIYPAFWPKASTVSAAGAVTGTWATTLANATAAVSAKETFSGTIAKTIAGATAAISGLETFTGTIAKTIAGATAVISGLETFAGSIAKTLAGATAALLGTETFTGSMEGTLGGATAVISAKETMSGVLSASLAGAEIICTEYETMIGALASSLSGAGLVASGIGGPDDAAVYGDMIRRRRRR